MNCTHENKIDKIAEYNLLYDILHPSKCTKNINSHSSPIINGCMNTRKVRDKFNNFRILLESGHSSTIVTRSLIEFKKRLCDTMAHGSR